MRRVKSWAVRALIVPCLLGCGMPAALAQTAPAPVQRAIAGVQQSQQRAVQSQQRVNALDEQTRGMLERYRAAVWQAQQLKVYVEQIGTLTDAQQADRETLQRQIDEMERVDRELLPLMLKMIDSLTRFVALDLPFLSDERNARIAELKHMMADAEIGNAEKFKRILDAYRIEVDYGHTLGIERVEIEGRVMDQLRVGRTALFALGLDGKSGLRWDAANQKWQALPHRYQSEVQRGLRIARETATADLLRLPVPVATRFSSGAGQ